MFLYPILMMIAAVVFLIGILFYIVALFNVKIKRKGLYFIVCLFWPISIFVIYLYISIVNRYRSRKLFF